MVIGFLFVYILGLGSNFEFIGEYVREIMLIEIVILNFFFNNIGVVLFGNVVLFVIVFVLFVLVVIIIENVRYLECIKFFVDFNNLLNIIMIRVIKFVIKLIFYVVFLFMVYVVGRSNIEILK